MDNMVDFTVKTFLYFYLHRNFFNPSASSYLSLSFSPQDNTNIDAAITCLVKSIMSVEEERALAEATSGACKGDPDGSVLVLPRFDYNTKEKGLGGCSGCLSIKPKQDQD